MPGASGEVEVEGMTGLALSSSTSMGRPVTYSRICYWELHRDWRDGAGSRCPSCSAGSPPSLRVRGVGLGAFGANERCVPSTPSYHHTVVFRGELIGTTGHNHEGRGSERRLGRPGGGYGMLFRIASKHCSESKGCTGCAWLCATVMALLQAVTRSVIAT